MQTYRDMGGLPGAGSSLTTASNGFLGPIVDIPLQQHQAWCWAAVLEGVSSLGGTPTRQCDIVSRVIREPSCPSSPGGPVKGRDTDLYSVAYAMYKMARDVPPRLKPVTFDVLQDWLTHKFIAVCTVTYPGSGSHCTAVTGCSSGKQVFVDDPWADVPFQGFMPYDDFLNAYDHGPPHDKPGWISEMYKMGGL